MHINRHDAFRPRVVFYLPAVTPWWFSTIIVPLLRAAVRGGKVHVLVPPLWSCTGVEAHNLAECAGLDITWHILDQDDHPALRYSKMHAGVVELVRQIDPDLCLCRSADIETPTAFPGVVRYIMEGQTDPFRTDHVAVQLCAGLFDHAIMPAIDPARAQWLEQAFAPSWTQRDAAFPSIERDAFLAKSGIPAGKLLVAMPLEFEHAEVFWKQHNLYPSNIDLIHALADQVDDDVMVLVTHHPINTRFLAHNFIEVNRAVRERIDKVRLIGDLTGEGTATDLMLRHCDGMIFSNTKCFTTAAFLGKPMLRLSKFETGDWLNAYGDLSAFLQDLRSGTAQPPASSDAVRWFAFLHANTVIDPNDPTLTFAHLMDHACNPVDPARWERGLARYLGADAALLPAMPPSIASLLPV